MKKLILLAFLTMIIIPVRAAHPGNTVALNDLVGIYKPIQPSTIPWFEIDKTADGKGVDIFILSEDLREKTKILTSDSGRFASPSWLTPQNLMASAKADVTSLPLGEISSQAVATPVGFILVQSQVYRNPANGFAGSDFIGFSQFSHSENSVLRIQWRSTRFTRESLSQGKVLESHQTIYFDKVSAI